MENLVNPSGFLSSTGKSYRDAAQWPSSSASSPPHSSDDPALSPAQITALQQLFPAQVVLSQAKFAESSLFWRFAVIGKCLGHDVTPETMEKALSPQWSAVGEWDIFPMSSGFFVIRFHSQEDRDSILFGGPWVVDGAALALSPFDHEFRPSQCQVTRAVVWVRLPDLPPAYWSEEIIADILSLMGRVIRVDDNTRNRSKGHYARAAVELDLRQPLQPGVTIAVEGGSPPSFWQQFKYENLHSFCSCCRRVGHRASACSSSSSPPKSSSSSSSATDPSASIEWAKLLLVRRRRGAPLRAAASPAVPTRGVNPHTTSAPLGPTEVGAGQFMDDATLSSDFPILPVPPSAGLTFTGPAFRPAKSSSTTTSAVQLKPAEPLGSGPSLQAASASVNVEKGDVGNPVAEMAVDESLLIQQIMDNNSDQDVHLTDDDDVLFSYVRKKNKNKSKNKMTEICLRPTPRDRASMKKSRVSAAPSSGKFSLLADLFNDVSADEIAAKYGRPP